MPWFTVSIPIPATLNLNVHVDDDHPDYDAVEQAFDDAMTMLGMDADRAELLELTRRIADITVGPAGYSVSADLLEARAVDTDEVMVEPLFPDS